MAIINHLYIMASQYPCHCKEELAILLVDPSAFTSLRLRVILSFMYFVVKRYSPSLFSLIISQAILYR
jgi:hypothetical protein